MYNFLSMVNLISWQQFGLKKDPYDTLPLVEGGDIPIEQAFASSSRNTFERRGAITERATTKITLPRRN